MEGIGFMLLFYSFKVLELLTILLQLYYSWYLSFLITTFKQLPEIQ